MWAPLRATWSVIFERFALSGKSWRDRIKERDLTKSFKWISAMLVLSCLQEDRTTWFHLVEKQDLHWFLKEKFRFQMLVTIERQRVRLLVPWVTFW